MTGPVFHCGPMMGSGGRMVALWVTPWVEESAVLDTRALADDALRARVAGRDVLPDDCVLLLVHPSRELGLYRSFSTAGLPTSSAYIADVLIDNACLLDEKLAARLDWRVRR
ncbi:MAG: hypothetical protein V4597_08315 [Pseudomonadota bacterium]